MEFKVGDELIWDGDTNWEYVVMEVYKDHYVLKWRKYSDDRRQDRGTVHRLDVEKHARKLTKLEKALK